jgi:hypothetical protein
MIHSSFTFTILLQIVPGIKSKFALFAVGFNTPLLAAVRFGNTNDKAVVNGFASKPPQLNNFLTERASSMSQRLQDTPP